MVCWVSWDMERGGGTYIPQAATIQVATKTVRVNSVANMRTAKKTWPKIQAVARSGRYGSIASVILWMRPLLVRGF